MTFIPLLIKDNFKHLKVPSQSDFSSDSPVNHALTHVAQEVAGLLQQAYPSQADGINTAKTIAIRALEPEYMQIITAELLTEREFEVLQLIVEGYKDSTIAEKLYITEGTVKTHVRNILQKLCVSNRTQAAIRGLRAGLVH